MIYTSHYPLTAWWVARCFEIRSGSQQCQTLSYARPLLLSWKTIGNSNAGCVVNRFILRLPVYVLNRSEEWIFPTESFCIKSTHICRVVLFSMQRLDCNLFRSNVQSFRTSIGPHCTEYCGNQDNGPPAAAHSMLRNIRIVSETKVQTIPQETKFTSTFEQGKTRGSR